MWICVVSYIAMCHFISYLFLFFCFAHAMTMGIIQANISEASSSEHNNNNSCKWQYDTKIHGFLSLTFGTQMPHDCGMETIRKCLTKPKPTTKTMAPSSFTTQNIVGTPEENRKTQRLYKSYITQETKRHPKPVCCVLWPQTHTDILFF